MKSNIIHAGINNGSISMYACNSRCGYHPHKIDFSWKNVTCKRCLGLIKRYKRYEDKERNLILFVPKDWKKNTKVKEV